MKTLDDFLHENDEGETLLWPAEADVWKEHFSYGSLPGTIDLLRNVRDVYIEAGQDENNCFCARDLMNFNVIISSLESLLILHMRQESEVIRNVVEVPNRFCYRPGLYG